GGPPPGRRPPPDEVLFRTAAAPGLEEDDLFAALAGLPGTGALWGDGMPRPGAPETPWDEERERRRRHEAALRRWPPAAPGA
ncbi:MAG TPA: hypothetical protein VNT51_05095, partial [Miltoncostaeaceae bacterium]|nr:hypothetical protein [Miltoncostaeaceae bacterium]